MKPLDAIRCTYSGCPCECFAPGKHSIRQCDTCTHGWVAHALDKLGNTHVTNLGLHVEVVQPNIVFDIASLMLYGAHATPVRLKILLDRLFSVLQHEEVLQVLHGFGWTYEDYARGYVLQDSSGRVLDKWYMATREEEMVVLQQFLRFGETKAIAQEIILQDTKDRHDVLVKQSPRTDSDIKKFIERSNLSMQNYLKSYESTRQLFGSRAIPFLAPPTTRMMTSPIISPNFSPNRDSRAVISLSQTPPTSTPTPSLATPPPNRIQTLPQQLTAPVNLTQAVNLTNSTNIDNNNKTPARPPVSDSPKNLSIVTTPVPSASISPTNQLQRPQLKQQPQPQQLLQQQQQKQQQQNQQQQQQHQQLQQQQQQQQQLQQQQPLHLQMQQDDLGNTSGDDEVDGSVSFQSDSEEEGEVLDYSHKDSNPGSPYDDKNKNGKQHSRKSSNPIKRQWTPSANFGSTLIGPNGKKRVLCTACNKTFCDKGALKIHYSAVHLKEMHKCSVEGCNMMFSSRRSRNRHSANPNPKLHMPQKRKDELDDSMTMEMSSTALINNGTPVSQQQQPLAPQPIVSVSNPIPILETPRILRPDSSFFVEMSSQFPFLPPPEKRIKVEDVPSNLMKIAPPGINVLKFPVTSNLTVKTSEEEPCDLSSKRMELVDKKLEIDLDASCNIDNDIVSKTQEPILVEEEGSRSMNGVKAGNRRKNNAPTRFATKPETLLNSSSNSESDGPLAIPKSEAVTDLSVHLNHYGGDVSRISAGPVVVNIEGIYQPSTGVDNGININDNTGLKLKTQLENENGRSKLPENFLDIKSQTCVSMVLAKSGNNGGGEQDDDEESDDDDDDEIDLEEEGKMVILENDNDESQDCSDGEASVLSNDSTSDCPAEYADKENPLKCAACGKIFQNNFTVKIHYQNVHLKVMHECKVDGCAATFPSKRSRDRHSANVNLHRRLASGETSGMEELDAALKGNILARLYGHDLVNSSNANTTITIASTTTPTTTTPIITPSTLIAASIPTTTTTSPDHQSKITLSLDDTAHYNNNNNNHHQHQQQTDNPLSLSNNNNNNNNNSINNNNNNNNNIAIKSNSNDSAIRLLTTKNSTFLNGHEEGSVVKPAALGLEINSLNGQATQPTQPSGPESLLDDSDDNNDNRKDEKSGFFPAVTTVTVTTPEHQQAPNSDLVSDGGSEERKGVSIDDIMSTRNRSRNRHKSRTSSPSSHKISV